MRINVYSQELTDEVTVTTKQAVGPDGAAEQFYGIRLYLHSSSRLHHTIHDDDRSAITFWLPKTRARRVVLARTLEQMAALVLQYVEEDN